MTKADLGELLERVEGASGPDREIDGAIHRTLFPTQRALVDSGDFRGLRPAVWGTLADLSVLSDRDIADYASASPYSASLDAALALVERALPGHRIEIWQNLDDDDWGAHFRRPETDTQYAKTPALAILAALFKALIAQETSHD